MIVVDSVVKKFAEKQALGGISLTVNPGQIFALVGLNGAGKSTLAKILMGFINADSGAITVCGHGAENPVLRRKNIGYLAEETVLYGELSAVEHLHYLAGLRFAEESQARRNEIVAKAQKVLDFFELGPAQSLPVKGYSKGMRRKAALACALLGEPPVLILDEPTSGLDPDGTLRFVEILSELKTQNHTVLINSHRLLEMQQRADVFGILDSGSLLGHGQLAELREQAGAPEANLEELFLTLTKRDRRSAAGLFSEKPTSNSATQGENE